MCVCIVWGGGVVGVGRCVGVGVGVLACGGGYVCGSVHLLACSLMCGMIYVVWFVDRMWYIYKCM